MIIVDYRSGAESQDKLTTVDKLIEHIRALGVRCDKGQLEFADAAFEGNGPAGRALIGIERKSLHDMLHCIDDSRYAAHQKPGMRTMYARSILMVEGIWKPRDPEGRLLMESQNGCSWYPSKYRSQAVLYSKLYRYLLSVALAGVIITYPRMLWETACHICEIYSYFQKKWEDHTAMLSTQTLAIPDLRSKPSLVRRWAADLEGIGVKYSLEAEELFRTPRKLALSDETEWLRIRGVGVKTAQQIIREITGR